MAARTKYDTCPHCGEIRNTASMTMHIRRKHGAAVAPSK